MPGAGTAAVMEADMAFPAWSLQSGEISAMWYEFRGIKCCGINTGCCGNIEACLT
jgi:hypothetical protein